MTINTFRAAGSDTAMALALVVIMALVLQNLLLVVAVARVAMPALPVAIVTLIKVAFLILTGPIGQPVLILLGLVSLAFIAFVARRPAARHLEVIR